ncbi:hypothetical protein DENIS_0119 [Desulfonema ishimotonii]|uniref:YbaK/aminoacyl-tRNA synthetase-associated domain-containing protein n=1 Tax=Desulfonema ishimotonii TaxID=45657 RepID=A0A401FQC3_9BACT|nr:YbaK/EbsC family protein [Desulfonema ishimotonii]GBC59183.1 hypothetical protein DENIS_0119 [Desulfonema ishimotonii]
MVFDNVMEMLGNSGCAFTLHSHQPIRTIEEAEAKVPHLTENLLKTVVFKIKDSHWILAAVAGPDHIHYKKLGEAFSVSRRKLRSVSPEQVETGLGFEVGGVGPFPVAEDVRIVIDAELAALDRIFCGSGKNTRTVEIAIKDLIALTVARVSSISR